MGRTLARALEYLNGVNGEIEDVVKALWPSKAQVAKARSRSTNP